MNNTEYHILLKNLVRNNEERYIDSKKQLEDLFKSSKLYVKEDLDWLKDFWREAKNKAEKGKNLCCNLRKSYKSHKFFRL